MSERRVGIAPSVAVRGALPPVQRTSPIKPSHILQQAPRYGCTKGNNDITSLPQLCDEVECTQHKIIHQNVTISLALRATDILKNQRDPERLDLRPYSTELTDALLNELANQLRVNLKQISTNHHNHRTTSYVFSIVNLSGLFPLHHSRITAVGMRSFIHAIGPTVRFLDCSKSSVPTNVLKVMASGITCLEALDFSHSPTLNAESLQVFLSCCSATLTKLNLSNCVMLSDEALGWIAGQLGPQGSLTQCMKLLSLDLSYTSIISDRGLCHIAAGCNALQFLNLEGMERITSNGILSIVQGCKLLRVLSLRKCMQLTDTVLTHIGRYGNNLRSLNLSCCYHLSSIGLQTMVLGTPQLQSLNLEGCRNMCEGILSFVAIHCPALQVLNLNGCQGITDNGIRTLSEHLPYVVQATHYRGLAPKQGALSLKFSIQEKTIQQSAAIRIQSLYRGRRDRKLAATWRREQIEVPAARCIQRQYKRYKLRNEILSRIKWKKIVYHATVKIQSWVRGIFCRFHLKLEEHERIRIAIWSTVAVKIQAVYRSHWTRRKWPLVAKTIFRHRLEQSFLRREQAAVRLQRAFRARLNRSRFDDIILINKRKRAEQHAAATKLQQLYRSRSQRKAYRQLQAAMQQHQAMVRELVKYAIKIQSQWRGYYARKHGVTHARALKQARDQRLYQAASRINAGVRGYYGRRRVQVMRVEYHTRLHALRVIQRAWRAYKSPSADALNMARVMRAVQAQAMEESLAARQKQDELIHKAREYANHDSASDPESEDDWRDFMDEQGNQFWFSPSRDQRYYVRPNEYAYEKSMLGLTCRVYWPLEQQWFEGTILRFNRTKQKHLIQYTDGDHEWLVLGKEGDRVQVNNEYCWCMARMFQPGVRALKAAVYLMLHVQYYDHAFMGWQSGVIQAYSERTDTFLIQSQDISGQKTTTWVDLFRQEHAVQVQDAVTTQWYTLSGYVFGHARGRPIGFIKPAQASWYYSVEDYLNYVEQVDPVGLINETREEGEHGDDAVNEDEEEEDEEEEDDDETGENDGDDENEDEDEEDEEEDNDNESEDDNQEEEEEEEED